MNTGRLVVLMYIGLYYLFPMFANLAFGQSSGSIYHYAPPRAPDILLFVCLFALCFTPPFGDSRWNLGHIPGDRICVAAYGLLQRYILLLSVAVLIIVILTFSPDWANYRYRSTGMSVLGMGFFVVLGLKALTAALLLWLSSEHIRKGEEVGWTERLSVLVLGGALLYSASGTADVFLVSLYLLLFLAPKWFVQFSTIQRSQNLLTPATLYKNLGIVVIFGLLMMSIGVGENIKDGKGSVGKSMLLAAEQGVRKLDSLAVVATGALRSKPEKRTIVTDRGVDHGLGRLSANQTGAASNLPGLTENGAPSSRWGAARHIANEADAALRWAFMRLQEGLSTHYYSALQFFNGHAVERLQRYATPISYPLQSVVYRLQTLVKTPAVERPNITSISLLNFRVLSDYPDERQGTSPGIVGSFAYLAPLPIAVFISIIYLTLIASLLNGMFYSNRLKLSVIGGLIVLIQTQILFESPIDFMVIIDDGFIFFASFVVLAYITARASAAWQKPEGKR